MPAGFFARFAPALANLGNSETFSCILVVKESRSARLSNMSPDTSTARHQRVQKVILEQNLQINRGFLGVVVRSPSTPSPRDYGQLEGEVKEENPFFQAMRTVTEVVSRRIIETRPDLTRLGQPFQSECQDPNLEEAIEWLRAGGFTVPQVRQGVLELLLPKRIKRNSGFGRVFSGAVLQTLLDLREEYPQDSGNDSNV